LWVGKEGTGVMGRGGNGSRGEGRGERELWVGEEGTGVMGREGGNGSLG